MDAAYELSSFLVDTTFADLTQDAIDVARKEVIDTLANTLGGSQDEGVREMYELVRSWGGREESTVIAYGGRFPAPNAAFVNSAMSAALAYHDTHERGHIHAESVVLPTAFAVSELKGGITGKELLTAICVGVELGARLGIATINARPHMMMDGWDYGPLHGHFTSAAVAGKILNLDKQKMQNALGIAYQQASGAVGSHQGVKGEKMVYGMSYSFASRSGITAALLAQRGVTGARDIFDESETGFYRMYHGGCNSEVFLKDLGKRFEMYDMSFKPYPGCRMCHRYIDAVMELVENNKIEVDEVEEITPVVLQFDEGLCLPKEEKVKPASPVAAYFSLPWALACAVVRKRVGTGEFTPEAFNDQSVIDMAAKVNAVPDPSLPDEFTPTKVTIRTRRGTFETKTGYARGDMRNPMTFEDMEQKLAGCAALAAVPVPEKNLAEAVSMIKNLEDVKNAERIVRLIAR